MSEGAEQIMPRDRQWASACTSLESILKRAHAIVEKTPPQNIKKGKKKREKITLIESDWQESCRCWEIILLFFQRFPGAQEKGKHPLRFHNLHDKSVSARKKLHKWLIVLFHIQICLPFSLSLFSFLSGYTCYQALRDTSDSSNLFLIRYYKSLIRFLMCIYHHPSSVLIRTCMCPNCNGMMGKE